MRLEVVVIGELVDDLLYLLELEAAHEAEGAALEGDDGRGFLRELLGGVQLCRRRQW